MLNIFNRNAHYEYPRPLDIRPMGVPITEEERLVIEERNKKIEEQQKKEREAFEEMLAFFDKVYKDLRDAYDRGDVTPLEMAQLISGIRH